MTILPITSKVDYTMVDCAMVDYAMVDYAMVDYTMGVQMTNAKSLMV